jgi:hypothetical protein
MSDEQTPAVATPIKGLKIKQTRHNRRKILSETATVVVTQINQKKYKGEEIGSTVRKDHKYDPKQRLYAGRAL